MSKVLGHNPVAVLATVLLISYVKMLKAIIVPLSPATIKTVVQTDSNVSINNTEMVWLYNGNMTYLGEPKHISLVAFAILILVLLFLPYTLLLLFGYWIQIKSDWRIFSWINKLKPFMDANYAPFVNGKCYWLGFFLLARCALFLNVAFTDLFDDYAVNLTVVSAVVAGLSIIKGRVYEKWYNDFLETSFLLNLCILSIASSYVQSTENNSDILRKKQIIFSSISIGIAFTFFIGIIAFHSYQHLRDLKLIQCMHMRKTYNLKKQRDKKAHNERSLEVVSNSSVNLRELLLDDDEP